MKKRICAVIMCLLLAVNLVGIPKAKAVVSEGALLGSIFGSLLVSLGYSWAADNMDVPTFGEAIYKLIQEFDEANKDTGVQLIRDLSFAALTSGRPGTIQFNYAWTQAARSFAEWFQGKFFFGDNTTAVVCSGTDYILDDNGFKITLSSFGAVGDGGASFVPESLGDFVYSIDDIDSVFYFNGMMIDAQLSSARLYIRYGMSSKYNTSWGSASGKYDAVTFFVLDGKLYPAFREYGSNFWWVPKLSASFALATGLIVNPTSLSAEKPVEVHYPDVAEDGSQVYEVTYQGVTATDIEGIIQGAVDQILAGTAAIAGEVTQAQDVPVTPEAPAAGEYAVPGLETIFPFCIPFDIYAFCSALNADPVAPSFEWRMQYAPLGLDYTFEIDLSAFDGVAQVLRTMELLAFCVGLAFWTRHLIRG